MLRTIRYPFHAVLVFMLITGMLAMAAGAAVSRKAPVARQVAKPRDGRSARKPRTPYERIFAPGVQRSVKAGAVTSEAKSARPAAAAAEEPSANFAGYPSGVPFTPCAAEIVGTSLCNSAATVAADFNQDGKQDIAYFTLYNYPGDNPTVTVLNVALGDGKGGFAAPIITGGGSAGSPPANELHANATTAVAADLNGDGYPDIAVLYQASGDYFYAENIVYVYFNQKDGTFSQPNPVAYGPTLPPHSAGQLDYSFALGDVNGDGVPDIVMLGSTQEDANPGVPNIVVATFLGTGGGRFANPQSSPQLSMLTLPIVFSSANITLADLNGDGRLDLAFQEEAIAPNFTTTLTAAYALGNGDGSFSNVGASSNQVITASVNYMPDGLGFGSTGVHVADLNNDGHPDIFMDLNNTLYAALGHGDGTFASQSIALSTPTFYSPSLTVADMNGDGKLDLIEISDVYAAVYLGTGNGTFNPQGSYVLALAPYETLADFNGDGKLDLVTVNSQDGLVTLGNGNGTLAGTPMLASNTNPVEIQLMATGDINGDGKTDVIFNNDGNPIPYYVANDQNDLMTGLSDGKGNFTYKNALSAAANANLGYIEPTTADFNGDGKQDILYVGSDNTLSVALSRGDGTFADPVSVGLPPLQCEVTYVPAGDLNGDGKLDLVAPYPGDASCGGTGSRPSGVFVLLGKGDGTFTLSMFSPLGSELYAASLVDLNGDGKLDLLLDDAPYDVSGTFQVLLLQGNGNGTFQTDAKQVSTGYAVSQMIAGDFNQDGKMDLMLLTAGDQGVTDPTFATAGVLLLPGNGNGTFGDPATIAAGNFFATGVFEDVNGDGVPDLTLAQETYDPSVGSFLGLATLLNIGNGTFSDPVSTYLPNNGTVTPSESLNIVLPGNFYADDAPDFVVGTVGGPALFLGLGGSTITLTASPASVPQMLTVTVTPSMSNRPTPTGEVSFYDGTTLLGQSSLSGGAATFAISTLSAGTHTITATYDGDSNTNANTAHLTEAILGMVTLSPSSLTFPATAVGSASSAQTVTFTNAGTTALTVSSFIFAGTNAAEFDIVSKGCGTALAAGASCNLSLAFKPTATGAATATFSAKDNAANSPQTVALSSSTPSSTTASFSPTSVTFPATAVGSTSAAKTVTFTNTGGAALSVSSFIFTGTNATYFEIVSKNCGTSLAAGATCTLSLAFKPTSVGSASATFQAKDSSTNPAQTVSLSGSTPTSTTASFSITSLTFPPTAVGSTSATQTVTFTNTGSSAMTVSSFTFAGTHAAELEILSKSCETSLPAGASCTLSLIFKPTAAGSVVATFQAQDSAINSPQSVTLSATGH